MGEAEIKDSRVIIHSVFYFYGGASSEQLSREIANDIETHWNEPGGMVKIAGHNHSVMFHVEGFWANSLQPEMVFENLNPRNNYFRIEAFSSSDISFVDGLGSNTGYFKLDNLLNHSTTAAHEYGHSLGLDHPKILDIRGQGVPGIMYPRGTIVDPPFQYSPVAKPLEPGGTINPFTRKVLQKDIDALFIGNRRFKNGFAIMGDFSSVWHEAHG